MASKIKMFKAEIYDLIASTQNFLHIFTNFLNLILAINLARLLFCLCEQQDKASDLAKYTSINSQ